MSLQRKKAKIGDILEVDMPGGLAYIHYIDSHPTFGDAISVSSKIDEKRPEVGGSLFEGSYITFYPVQIGVRQGVLRVVGNAHSRGLPEKLRILGEIRNGRILSWSIFSEGKQGPFKSDLSEEEWGLPIVSVWNHEFLVHRILEGWRPEFERFGPS